MIFFPTETLFRENYFRNARVAGLGKTSNFVQCEFFGCAIFFSQAVYIYHDNHECRNLHWITGSCYIHLQALKPCCMQACVICKLNSLAVFLLVIYKTPCQLTASSSY